MDGDLTFEFNTNVSFFDELIGVALLSLALSIYALLTWLVYRTMSEQRLPIVRETDRPPHITWGGAMRYIATTPLMMLFWYLAMMVLFSLATTDRSAVEISTALAATIGGVRILAQFNPGLAHDVAKIVPLVMVSVVLIGGNIAEEDQIQRVLDELDGLGDLITFDILALVTLDYLVTIGWFLKQRLAWRRRERRSRRGKPAHGPLVRAWRTWRNVGYTEGTSDAVSASPARDDGTPRQGVGVDDRS